MLVLARRTADLPAEYYEELMDTPPPMRGVRVITDKEGRIIDVQRDPQEFDGPDGVPEGWHRTPQQHEKDGVGMLLAMGFIALVFFATIAVAVLAAAYVVYLTFFR